MRVRKDHDKNKGVPLLVHCAAGCGRTGVFILIDSMIDQLMEEDSINVYEFVRQMRTKRIYMVQTEVRMSQDLASIIPPFIITFRDSISLLMMLWMSYLHVMRLVFWHSL